MAPPLSSRALAPRAVLRPCVAALALAVACDRPADAPRAPLPPPGATLFTRLPAAATGIRFANRVTDTPERNVFTYRNHYNGGGVAIGDLSGDGLPEVVLSSNEGGVTLYLNLGGFRFRDVTREAGLAARAPWTTGVLLADLTGDGRLDLYVSRAGSGEPATRANALFVHQGVQGGVPRFTDGARALGIADEGWSTQAAVLDYDRDGDLDLFVVNNSPRPVTSFGTRNRRDTRHPHAGHHLYRNDGGRFADVSAAAGIHGPEMAFGLGVGVGDVNRDGWPDLYVANDFFERDYLYVNRGDGTFDESLDRRAPVLSYFSMGMDIGDVDNDGWPELVTTDMMPADERRLKTTAMFEGWDVYQAKVRDGYHHQLMRNMLQRNNRDGTFTDVGYLAGVAETDWSWSALLVDLDLDGRKDLYVTNGLARDVTSQDYVAFLADRQTMEAERQRRRVDFLRLVNAMAVTPIPNAAFRNSGDFRFTDAAAAWGLAVPSISSGAAWGDLDGDGAPDLVVNNTNAEAMVFRNDARARPEPPHALPVRLRGAGANPFAVGAHVAVHAGGTVQVQELYPSRGFQSSVDYTLPFGLGASRAADSVLVTWPDGRTTVRTGVPADTVLTVTLGDDARPAATVARPAAPRPWLAVADSLPAPHAENDFVDFDRERLIPHMLSTEGPALAVADVDGDGLDDAYLGGAKDQPGRLLRQQRDGRFIADSAPFLADAASEDVGALFLDVDRDGDRDLLVVSGGNEYSDESPALQDRLYRNDGRGRFTRDAAALPADSVSGSRVAAADVDGDGDLDLVVGGRSVPWKYGLSPRTTLLRNDGRGRFADVTATLAPALAEVGMVTDLLFTDLDGDARPDLLLVGEWMPVTAFRNAGGGRLVPMPLPGLEASAGWWNRIVPADLDGDGRPEFVLGNLGRNARLRASPREPLTLLVKDFDANGYVEPVLAMYNQGRSYPFPLRDELIRALPPMKVRYLKYEDYALQTMDAVFPASARGGAVERRVDTFDSGVLRRAPGGRWRLDPLPQEAQLAPVYAILPLDADGDGHLDLLLGGNLDGFRTDVGRLAASRGLLLRNDGRGTLAPVAADAGGVRLPGQLRDAALVRTARGPRVVVARNNAHALLLSPIAPRGSRP